MSQTRLKDIVYTLTFFKADSYLQRNKQYFIPDSEDTRKPGIISKSNKLSIHF